MTWKDGCLQMAIKMRNNNDKDAFCVECGDEQDRVLNMFDVCIGGQIFTICDKCNEVLFNKTLHAECFKNGRLKSQKDLQIIRRRTSHVGTRQDGGNHLSINDALKDVKGE